MGQRITAGLIGLIVSLNFSSVQGAAAPDRAIGVHSARVMSQSFPWLAQEAGLFKKYNFDVNLVFIASSAIVTEALLGGDTEMTITGGIGNVPAVAKGYHLRARSEDSLCRDFLCHQELDDRPEAAGAG